MKIKKGSFGRNILKMMTGNVFAQAVTFLCAPIITRIYTPEDFGYMTIFMAVISILSILACFRYEQAIVLPRRDIEAINVFALCMMICFSITLMITISLAFFQDLVLSIYEIPGLMYLLWLAPIGIFLTGVKNSFAFWQTRRVRFGILSISQVFNAIFSGPFKIVVGLSAGPSALWLAVGNVFGVLASVILLGGLFIAKDFFRLKKNISWKRILHFAGRYAKFPKYHLWTGVLNTLSQNVPFFFIGYLFSSNIVGFYGLANTVLRKPIEVISQSMTNVFLQKAAETYAGGKNLSGELKKATLGLAAVGAVPFAFLAVGGELVFTFIFGEPWAEAGFYSQLLTPWLFLAFINPPATQVIVVTQQLRFNLIFNFALVFLRILAIFGGFLVSPKPWVAIAFFSLVGFLGNFYYIKFAFTVVREKRMIISVKP
jgi:O-antigen/teichoic acid export membrane protein